VLWWSGYESGSISFGRWLAIGVVLAFAGLLKGPQPIAYFALGIGAFVLAMRAWRQLAGLVLAGLICAAPLAAWYAATYTPGDGETWTAFMRLSRPHEIFPGPLLASVKLLADTLPAALFAAAFLISYGFREKRVIRPALVAALCCYAFIAALLMLFWPGGSASRYYFPLVLPLCVFGGLGYDQLGARRPEIAAPIVLLTAVLLLYALAYTAAAPLLPMRFRQAQIDGMRMTAAVQSAPAPIYWSGDVALNVLPYVPGQIHGVGFQQLATTPGPAWIVLSTGEADALQTERPDKLHIVMPLGEMEQWRLLRLDK
jgi:hypothetical protein